VRGGLVPHIRRELLSKLKPLEIKECPFVNLPDAPASWSVWLSTVSKWIKLISNHDGPSGR
jgi:hypothetical protein